MNTEKKQFNIRISKAGRKYLADLVKKYGTKTAVIEIALRDLYQREINTITEKPPKPFIAAIEIKEGQ